MNKNAYNFYKNWQNNQDDSKRCHLLLNSFVIISLVTQIRKKHNINAKQTPQKWIEKCKKLYNNQLNELEMEMGGKRPVFTLSRHLNKKILPEIGILAKELNINEDILMAFVLYNNVPEILYGPNRLFTVTKNKPLVEEGVYLKLDPDLDPIKLVKSLKIQIGFLLRGYQKNNYSVNKKNNTGNKETDKIKVYLQVEREISSLKEEIELIPGIVGMAIERVAGNITDNISDNDQEFDSRLIEIKKMVHGYYYDILEKFGIPSFTDLATLSRFIDSKS